MAKPRVVIVGAGPSGATCALQLARSGKTEVVLLDKSTYPRVKVCGSGLSPLALKILQRLDLLDKFEPLHAEMVGMRAKGPGGHEVALRGGKGAWVVPRVEFDHGIVTEAIRAGVGFRPETKVVEILKRDGVAHGVRTTDDAIEADLVICANGSPSRFSNDTRPKYAIRTIMGWWRETTLPADECVMIWDRRLEGYYAWSFPEPDGVVNIGLTIPEDAEHARRLKPLFTDLLGEHFAVDMKDAEQIGKWMGHPATLTTRIGTVAEARTMFIGEAARLVSPATVEGISFAMDSGMIAADFVDRHFDRRTGYTHADAMRYRATLTTHFIPKFLAAEAFVRVMHSELARRIGHRIIRGRVNQAFSKAISNFLG